MSHDNSLSDIGQKPKQVRTAILLLYIYSVISFLIVVIFSIINNGQFSGGLFCVQLLIFLIGVFLIFQTSKGKTWSRNIIRLFFVLGVFGSLWLLIGIKDEFKYQFIIMAIQYSVGLIIIFPLYRKPAQEWFETFKKHKNNVQSS